MVFSLSFHLALIYFPAHYAPSGFANVGYLPERGGVTPLSVTLEVARTDFPLADTHTGVTQIEVAPDESQVEISSVANNEKNKPIEAVAGGGLPLGPELVYYTTDKLSKSPEVIAMDELNTPETRVYKVSGSLVLSLWIDDQGKVTKVAVEDSALPPIFAQTAVRVFKGARFSPGVRDSLRVGTLMRVEVGYEDKGLPVAR